MDAQRWQQIEEIFQSALDLSPAERASFIAEQSGDDSELKAEVEKLMADYSSADSFIETPAWTRNQLLNPTAIESFENSFEQLKADLPDPMIGKKIGAYRLTSEIGRGGMGAVYLATRDDGSFRQTVAVKLIKRGMDTDFILRRFRQERQILAALNHPFIARLLDGGTTEDNLPFFVMEFIDGKPLYKYSDRRKLTINERLKLFRQICEALDFAHQNQVIHRDIKPPNILVCNDGTPKLLDFGIAKVLNPEIGINTIDPTATAMRLMTPEYASPEQVCGSPVTPASDIYSLGVLLYELLTGHRPYQFKNRAPHEIARVICEEDPMRPSTGITQNDNLLPTGASEATTLVDIYVFRGAANIEELQREISGDLERIILKCLRKEASERYQNAAALAADITRYLNGETVAAETSFPKRAAQTAVKEKTASKSLAVLPLKILNTGANADTGEDFLSVGLADALISRLSGINRLIVRPTSSVLRLNAADPFAAGRELGVDFVVDGNLRRVGERVRVTAQLLNVRENATYWSESFDEQFTDVLALEDSLSERVVKSLIPQLTGEEERQLNKRGTNNADAYEAFLRGRVNWNLQSEEGFARAIGFYNRAVELDPNYALAYTAIAEYHIFLGIHCIIPFAEGARVAKKLIEKAVALDSTLAAARAVQGFSVLAYDWNWTAAEQHLRRAVELNPNSVTAHNWLSTVFLQTGRFDDALREIERVVELDPDSILSLHIRAWTLYHARRFDESIAAHERLLADEPNYAWGLQSYSWALRRVGRAAEAVAPAERSVQLTGENPFYLTSLAAAYADAGDAEKAEKILTRLKEISENRFVSDYTLALVYCALKDKDRAFAMLEKSFETRDGWLNWLGVEPQFDVLKTDARYDDLMRRAGNLLAKREAARTGEPAATADEKSIAVLPLKLFGAPTGSGEEYLGIGLADALVTRLSNVRRLIVRPTSSVLPFGDAQTNPFQAGEKLGVGYVLDGNIRRVADRIRVTVQLLSVGENSTRWAQSFDENFSDVLALEDSISEQVAKFLIPKLTGEEQQKLQKRGTNSPEAFEAYMRGRYHWNQFTPAALLKAREAFETAIRLDANYAAAHVGLADFYIWANIYGMIPSAEAVKLAQAAANRAIEIDAQLGEAYASLGLTYQNRFSWARAAELYEQSLKLAPNYVHAHEWYAAQLVGHGDFTAGVEEIKITERLDPLSLRTKTLTAWTLYQAGRYDEALARGRQIVDLDPNYPQGNLQIGIALLAMKRAQEALPFFQKFDALIPDSALVKYNLCFAFAAAHRRDDARRVLEEIKNLASREYVKPYFLAMAHAALDERDAAFENFRKAVDENDPWMLWFGTEPLLDNLRGDARCDELLRLMNNPLAGREKTKAEKPPAATNSEKSIAVLPLKLIVTTGALAADTGDDNYLSIGLADALITRLSNVRRFVVRPTSSVLPYGKNQTDAFAAGGELGVDYIVDGTIRRVGNRIRVTAQLLGAAQHSTLWAQTFDEDYADVLALEDSISRKIVESLVPHLTGEEERQIKKRGTDNRAAFEAYLRGRHYWNTFTEEGFAKALIFYNQAIAAAPDYALAYAGIADYYNLLGVYTVMPFHETSAAAKEAALKAIAADPNLAEGYAALGFAVLMQDFDWTTAEKHLRRAVELNPNYVTGLIWYGYFLGIKGEWEAALKYIGRARSLDPHTPVVSHTWNLTLYYARRFDEAVEATEKFIEREPRYGLAQLFFSSVLWTIGRAGEAVKMASRAIEFLGRNTYTLTWLASAHAANGEADKARELLAEIEEQSARRYTSPYLLAVIYANLNDTEQTLEQLERAWEIRDGRLVWLAVDPQFDRVRDEPRFAEILRLTKNPQAEKSRRQ